MATLGSSLAPPLASSGGAAPIATDAAVTVSPFAAFQPQPAAVPPAAAGALPAAAGAALSPAANSLDPLAAGLGPEDMMEGLDTFSGGDLALDPELLSQFLASPMHSGAAPVGAVAGGALPGLPGLPGLPPLSMASIDLPDIADLIRQQ